MEYLLIFASGVLFGVILVLVINWLRRPQARELAQQLVDTVETQRVDDMEKILVRVKESFQALSLEALSNSTTEFLKHQTVRGRSYEKELDPPKI